MLITGTGKQLLIVIEIIANGRKDTLRNRIHADGREIELRAGNRNEYINKVVDEKAGDQYKRHLLKQVEPIDEIEQRHNQNHRIISEIAHVERLAHPHLRKRMTEPYGRLSAEHPLLGRSKQMIQIGEDAVELESIRIPVG